MWSPCQRGLLKNYDSQYGFQQGAFKTSAGGHNFKEADMGLFTLLIIINGAKRA